MFADRLGPCLAEASSIEELRRPIDGFVRYYPEVRPHQAEGCPPMHVWRTLDKATPTLAGQQLLAKSRVRHDRVDDTGAVTLRYRRRLTRSASDAATRDGASLRTTASRSDTSH
ncbi:MAG TPA: hypothetical protein VNF05_06720 [Acidimicrobiales bacterium]|nr:hypothetical protein [Acidimicrobiales bacterium]